MPGAGHDLDPPERARAVGADRRSATATSSRSSPTTRRRCGPSTTCATPTTRLVTKSFDLLWRGIELTTGAQREHRHDRLLAQADDKGVDVGPIGYYLDFFRFGAPPHGGFGFGLTRLLMQMLGQDNVREVTFLYRGPHRLSRRAQQDGRWIVSTPGAARPDFDHAKTSSVAPQPNY